MSRRILGLLTAVVMLSAACSTEAGSRPRVDAEVDAEVEVVGASALDDPRHPGFPEPLIDPDHLFSGGPPPDGIPPIDDPKFEPVSDVDWLEGNEPVLSLTVADETRAYPLQVMAWHEIVNDTVGGVPVAVTFCPLCNSGVAFERRVEDRLLDFGTSGLLYVDNLVMYDRQTESLWPQLTGRASVGVLTGTRLESIPMGIVGWKQFRESHPEAMVLTRDTGFVRDYGSNPYVWRDDDPNGDLFADPPGGTDRRLPVKERIVGIMVNGQSVAVRRSHIVERRLVELTVGGRDLVVWHRSGQASALDADGYHDGEEVGTVGVFRPLLDGRRLTFAVRAGRLIDEQTGSAWNVLGEATSGQLTGSRLPAVVHLDTFWFVWVAFRPRTRVVE
ncbi:DUF3179 domain-containing protein [Nocardioides flavus (ex Wang et al. 2016)]|uniref:DUF3179 domain-containing protein n=1 Tax=Nocardioides flavus (ex Wang et al. 2016) TaxID=2058780 RepID=UPI00174D7BE0|nr:DUF3179 domain-containing protein [Nocardioides flavus (ex Wang et al. 2016)]